MKRIIGAAAAAAILAGLAGCGAEDTAQAPAEEPVAAAPANDDERMCRAVEADLSVGDKRLDNVDAGESERVLRIVEDLERRLDRYAGAGDDLKAAVQEIADHYRAAAGKLGKSEAYAAEVVKLRAAQTKLLGTCS